MHMSNLQSLIVNVLQRTRKYLPEPALWKSIQGSEILYQEHHDKLVSSAFFWNSLKNKSKFNFININHNFFVFINSFQSNLFQGIYFNLL